MWGERPSIGVRLDFTEQWGGAAMRPIVRYKENLNSLSLFAPVIISCKLLAVSR
jgi:hypothetical protein